MTRRNDQDLMQYHDGELPPGEVDAVRAEVDANATARAKIEGLEELGEALQTYGELAADDVEPRLDSLWLTIERGINANGEAPEGISSEAERSVAKEPRRGLLVALGRWFNKHRAYFGTGVVAAAAAAALVLVVRRPVERVVLVPTPVTPVASTEPTPPPIVENLEVYDGSGTVLTFPAEDGASATAVIWITRDTDDSEGPI